MAGSASSSSRSRFPFQRRRNRQVEGTHDLGQLVRRHHEPPAPPLRHRFPLAVDQVERVERHISQGEVDRFDRVTLQPECRPAQLDLGDPPASGRHDHWRAFETHPGALVEGELLHSRPGDGVLGGRASPEFRCGDQQGG